MQHKVKVTVIRKLLFEDLQEKYCADPNSGECPMYNVGDEFIFERYGDRDDFWKMGNGKQCSEAWDAISRYVYAGLQGGAIMHGWTNDDRVMPCCCSDATRPVLFEVRRMDYKVVKIDGMSCQNCAAKIQKALESIEGIDKVEVRLEKKWAEVYTKQDQDPSDEDITKLIEDVGYTVTGID